MYESFYGLERTPFSITPDPGFLYQSQQHREALSGLSYAILGRKGYGLLTGKAGTGKTTLISKLFQHIPSSRIVSNIVFNPVLSPSEFLEMVLVDFGVTDIPASKARRILALQHFLINVFRQDKIAVLVVDEAHKLSFETLEEIRLLGNFDNFNQKLLQVLLVGQPELNAYLNKPELAQMKQRIAVSLKLDPLSPQEIQRYVECRWFRAGGDIKLPFTTEAIAAIAEHSSGIPRLINCICDNALLSAFADGSPTVKASHVFTAAMDLDLVDRAAVSPASQPAASVLAPPVAAAHAPTTAGPAGPVFEHISDYGSIRTLERYATGANQSSLLSRWSKRLWA